MPTLQIGTCFDRFPCIPVRIVYIVSLWFCCGKTLRCWSRVVGGNKAWMVVDDVRKGIEVGIDLLQLLSPLVFKYFTLISRIGNLKWEPNRVWVRKGSLKNLERERCLGSTHGSHWKYFKAAGFALSFKQGFYRKGIVAGPSLNFHQIRGQSIYIYLSLSLSLSLMYAGRYIFKENIRSSPWVKTVLKKLSEYSGLNQFMRLRWIFPFISFRER